MKKIAMLLSFLLVLGCAISTSASPLCRTHDEHRICLVEVKRSAKNHWEYRAVVSIDGIERPQELYNCREQVRVSADGVVVPFEPNGAGMLICRVLHR
jgi:hypothetical protein